jgi:hypothetical protein
MTTKSPPQPIGEVIADLEAAALAGHAAGLTWTQFYGQCWNRGLVQAARRDPGGYSRLAERLLGLLTSGDTSGRLAAGDEDVDLPAPGVVPAVDDVTAQAWLLRPEATP